MATVPFRPEDITTEWLSEAVGAKVTGFESEQIGIGVGLLGRLYRLTLQGDGPASVIAKCPTTDEGARMHVIEPLNFYEKEVRFYEELANETPIRTPSVYFAHFDPESRDFLLLLEDLSSRRIEDQIAGCRSADALIAIDAIAEHHAHFWESKRLEELPWLLKLSDPPYPQVIAGMYKQAWPRAQEVLGDSLPEAYQEYGDRFADLVEWFCDELTQPPVTFVHGDYRLDNFFFGNGDKSIVIVDWQIGFRGRAGYDLGYFTSQSLTTDERRGCEEALMSSYLEAITAKGVDYPADMLRSDYAKTVAFCFTYPIVAAGQIEASNQRQVDLVKEMVGRAVRAIEDNNALSLLPKT